MCSALFGGHYYIVIDGARASMCRIATVTEVDHVPIPLMRRRVQLDTDMRNPDPEGVRPTVAGLVLSLVERTLAEPSSSLLCCI